MSEVKWIKLDVNLFDNRKIKMLEALPDGCAMVVVWLKLLCLAGQTNDGGAVYFTKEIPYTEEMMATVFGMPIVIIRSALNYFEQFGMIERVNDIMYLSSWEEYQNVEGMEKIREQNRERKQRQREREKLLLEEPMSRDCHVTVTGSHATDIEEEIDIDLKEKEILKKKKGRFAPPSVEEVKAYCEERGNSVDPESFVDFYESKGWKVGSNPMKDWKAAVRTWEKREQSSPKQSNGIDWNKMY